MLVRFAYLAVSHVFAALRLLPMTDSEKDAEILALRHQLAVPKGKPCKDLASKALDERSGPRSVGEGIRQGSPQSPSNEHFRCS